MTGIESKVHEALDELKDVDQLAMDPALIKDQKRYAKVMRQYQQGIELKGAYQRYQNLKTQLADVRLALQSEKDKDMLALYEEELPTLEQDFKQAIEDLKLLLVPVDPF